MAMIASIVGMICRLDAFDPGQTAGKLLRSMDEDRQTRSANAHVFFFKTHLENGRFLVRFFKVQTTILAIHMSLTRSVTRNTYAPHAFDRPA